MERPDLEVLRGAIDMHAHTAPALFPRPIRDTDLAKAALDFGMRGFVLKDHDSMTTHRAGYVKRNFPSLEPIGAIVLNRSVGGLNPHVVQAALQYGTRVVWMPTNHSAHHHDYFGMPNYPQIGRMKAQLPGAPVTILDADGRVTEDVRTIVELVAAEDACLCTGHLSLEETRLLQDVAIEKGLRRFLVTHVNWALTKYELDIQRDLIRRGAFLEYVALTSVSPTFHEQSVGEFAAWISEMNGDNLVLSSDLGQGSGPSHPEGLRMMAYSLLQEGVKREHLEKMLQHNPAVLCGLES